MTVKRIDNVGIVVEDIDAAIEFFTELGLELEGRAPVEGDWADGVTGLRDLRVEIAMMRTPDGHSRLELFPQASRLRTSGTSTPNLAINRRRPATLVVASVSSAPVTLHAGRQGGATRAFDPKRMFEAR